ncbi:MAG: transcription elongation factor GreB [Deltaproteobacteria bacterium]|nr:transcription elongation factor GreB [Deltaproteobacteria bacterium]
MSKAFVKEGGEEPGADTGEEAGDDAAATRGSPYITPAGFRRLQQELEHLWRVERPKVTHEVAVAAAQGDRSENAEYIYGKKRLREIDRRVRFLSKRLDVVQVVEPSKEQEGKVFFGAWVTIEDEDGHEATYRIVGTDEPDAKLGWISVESPVARALLGKRAGDVVTVRRPKGETEVTVVAIAYRDPKARG